VKELTKKNLKDFKESWTLCIQCAACYYRGPVIPHNWLELPPPEWSSPLHKCPSFEYFKFRAYTAVGRGNLATLVFDDDRFPVTDDLMKIVYTCTSCGKQVADTIVTGCTSCFSNMNKVVETEGIELEIRDISVLVAKAMGIRL
jgi:hypothetical protein